MSEAIACFDRCSRMIPPGVLARGAALATGDIRLCAACLEALPPEKRDAVTRETRRVDARPARLENERRAGAQGGAGQKIGSVRPGDGLVFRAWAKGSRKGEVGRVGVDFYDAAKKKNGLRTELRNTACDQKTQIRSRRRPTRPRRPSGPGGPTASAGSLHVDGSSLEKVEG